MKIYNDQPIQFEIEGRHLVSVIKKISAIIKTTTLIIAASDGKLALILSDNDRYMIHDLDAVNVLNNGCFMVSTANLIGLFGNRGHLRVKQSKLLEFNAVDGPYKGQLNLQLVAPELVDNLNAVFSRSLEAFNLDQDTLKVLSQGIKFCSLTDIFGVNDKQFVRYLRGEGRELQVFSYDNYHSANWQAQLDDELKQDFTLAVYPVYFQYLNSLAKNDEIQVAISDRLFCLTNDKFRLFLPPVQLDRKQVKRHLKAIEAMEDEAKPFRAILDSALLKTLIANFYALHDNGNGMLVQVQDQQLCFSLASDLGVVSDTLELDKVKNGLDDPKTSILVNAAILKDVVDQSPLTKAIFQFNDRYYQLTFKKQAFRLNYVVALMQKK